MNLISKRNLLRSIAAITSVFFKQIRLLITVMLYLNALSLFSQNSVKPNSIYNEGLYTKSFTYNTLSAYQKSIFDEFVENEFPKGAVIDDVLNDKASTREKTRLAEALLYRGESGDQENAIAVIEWILKLQNLDKNSQDYGVWQGGTIHNGRYDQNMREFIGCDLIVIYHKYKTSLPPEILKRIEISLLHAARGALIRNVDPDYNNISIMSSFMMEYVGTEFNVPELTTSGIIKAKNILANFQKYNTLCEYNSPTYYGVDFVGLALWRELSFSKELKEMGRILERELWLDVASFYNANLQNMSGPYLRSYGIDMKKYTAIVGVWIAAAVDDPAIATVPGKLGSHNESNFIVPIFDLGISMPEEVLSQFKQFDKPRFISRTTSNYYEGDRLKKVTANIQKDWMMGGLWGNRKVSRILMAGTMHWQAKDGDIGWLYVPGEGKTNVRVDETQMEIYLSDMEAEDFAIHVYSKDISPEDFKNESWNFPLMQLGIETSLQQKSIEIMDRETLIQNIESDMYYPFAIRVVYEIPANWNALEPLIVITPNKKNRNE